MILNFLKKVVNLEEGLEVFDVRMVIFCLRINFFIWYFFVWGDFCVFRLFFFFICIDDNE